jgi:hypothetical protein
VTDRDLGRWVRLAGNYPVDPRILAVGAYAELVFVRGLAIARQFGTDGHIATSMLGLLGRGLPRGALGRATVELVTSGLWETCDDGWAVPAGRWEKWQTTQAQYDEKRERERARKADYRRRLRQSQIGEEPP